MTRWLAIALAVSGGAAQGSDGGLDAPLLAAGVRSGALELDDGRAVLVDGGVWLSDALALERAKDLERLAAENKALKAAPVVPPPVFVVALVLVATAAYVGGIFTPRF